MYWNKGSAYLTNKMADVRTLVEKHPPMIFGLGEANITCHQDLTDLQLIDYTLHLPLSIKNPEINLARVAVYMHKKLVVRRREDLEDSETQAIFLECGLSNQ